MRHAVLIIGLLLGALMFFQTFLISVLSDVADDETGGQAAAVGLLMAFLWLIACGLVLPVPMVSVVLFVLAGIFGFANSGEFPDLGIWGGISLVLAVMSFLGWRGKRKEKREGAAERLRQFNRDERLETLLQQQQAQLSAIQPTQAPVAKVTFPNFCTSCGTRNEPGARFCAECGTSLSPSVSAT